MTPQDHNRTISIIYSLLGLLLAGTAIILLVRDLSRHHEWARAIYKDELFIAAAVISTYLLTTVYEMIRRNGWTRVLALITTIFFFVFLFPLGIILSVYIWWFMHSDGAKQLYSKPST